MLLAYCDYTLNIKTNENIHKTNNAKTLKICYKYSVEQKSGNRQKSRKLCNTIRITQNKNARDI